jgi:hypothetical protein
MKLELNEQDLKEVNNYLQELPLKFGLPLLNFINKKIVEQNEVTEVVGEDAAE